MLTKTESCTLQAELRESLSFFWTPVLQISTHEMIAVVRRLPLLL